MVAFLVALLPMASVHRRVSPTGALSPYWSAKFRDASGRAMMKSTKEMDRRKALKIAQAWERAARMAAAGELTQAASMQLLDALMQETTGQRFNTQGIEDFCKEWLAGRKQVGKAASTLCNPANASQCGSSSKLCENRGCNPEIEFCPTFGRRARS